MKNLNLQNLKQWTSNKEPYSLSSRINNTSTTRLPPANHHSSRRSLNESKLSTKSDKSKMSKMIKLPNYFYNDRKDIYA